MADSGDFCAEFLRYLFRGCQGEHRENLGAGGESVLEEDKAVTLAGASRRRLVFIPSEEASPSLQAEVWCPECGRSVVSVASLVYL